MAKKSKWWCFEVYQEHWNEEVVKFLEGTHLEIVCALHDKDLTEKGEPKKAHYHVLVKYGNTTTLNCIQDIFGSIAANGVVFPVTSPRGMYRYLRHLDNPEKYQYPEEVYQYINGFDVTDVTSDTDFENILQEIDGEIIDNSIVYYHELIGHYLELGKLTHIKAIHKHSNHVKNMLSSVKLKIDKETKQKEKEMKKGQMRIGEKKKYELKYLPDSDQLEAMMKAGATADDILSTIRKAIINADESLAEQ